MRRRALVTAAVGAGTLVLLAASAARSDDPVTSAVRFNREIVRIFDRKCVSCHAPDGIAMSLVTYREVRPWSRAIREELVEQRMPPTSAARGYTRLQNDIALTPRELATILTWVDGGVPKGDDADLPPRRRVAAGPEPDHRVPMPEQQLPGDGADVVRRVTVETGLAADRWVRQLQLHPGDRRLLRAAFVSIVKPDGSEVWAGAWTPWHPAVAIESPAAFLVPRGARLAVELHYRGQAAPTSDLSDIALYFAPEGKWRDMTSLVLAPSAGGPRAAAPARAAVTLGEAVVVLGGRLDAVGEGASVEVTARTREGHTEVLLWIPKFQAAWPAPFIFEDPVRLPGGTVISVTTTGTDASRVRAILTLHASD